MNNRRSFLKLLGGTITVGLLPKPPLMAKGGFTPRTELTTIQPQFERIMAGWSAIQNRFVYLDEIKEVSYFKDVDLGNGKARVMGTDIGEVMVSGTVRVPIVLGEPRATKILKGVEVWP